MLRRLRDRGWPVGRTRNVRSAQPGVEAIESRLLLSTAVETPTRIVGVGRDALVIFDAAGVQAQQNAATAALTLTIDTYPSGLLSVGQNVTYVVTVANNGPDAATNVVVVDTPPTNAAFLGATEGTFADGKLTVDFGTVEPGTAKQVALVVAANQAGNLINQAYVTTSTTDPNINDNVAYTFQQVVAPVTPPGPPQNLAAPPPKVLAVGRYGFHGSPIGYAIQFDRPMNAASVRRSGSYILETPGPQGRLSGSRNIPIPIASIGYNPATATVILVPARRISLSDTVLLRINGDMGGVYSQQGILLDGNNDGRPGGDYETVIQGFNAGPVPRPILPTRPFPRRG